MTPTIAIALFAIACTSGGAGYAIGYVCGHMQGWTEGFNAMKRISGNVKPSP